MSSLKIDESERQDVLGMFDRGLDPLEISRRLNLNIITVSNIINKRNKSLNPVHIDKPQTVKSFEDLGKVIKMAKPQKNKHFRYTQEQIDEALEFVDSGMTPAQVSHDLGMSDRTIYKWINNRAAKLSEEKEAKRAARKAAKDAKEKTAKPASAAALPSDPREALIAFLNEENARKQRMIDLLLEQR